MHKAFAQRGAAPLLAAGVLLLLAGRAAVAAIHVRLVDQKEEVPLEFWVKDVPLPWGGAMHYRMPQKAYVDGRAVAFVRYGQDGEGGVLGGEEKKDNVGGIGEDLVTDLGGGGPKEKEFKSDRTLDVLNGFGPKALIKQDFAAGKHLLQPGAQAFTVDEHGTVEKGDVSLVRTSAEALQLVCRPVDLNLLPIAGMAREVPVCIKSGDLVVFEETFKLDGPQVLRIYLPPSAEPYEIEAGDRGSVRLLVGKEEAKAEGKLALAPGVRLIIEGTTLALAPREAASRKAKAAAAAKKPELYLFTDRGREVYLEGERAQVSLRAFGPEGAPQEARITLRDGERTVELGTVKLTRAQNVLSAEFELDTRLLRPGAYGLRAGWAGAESNVLTLRVASAMRATSMKLFSHLKWGPFSMAPDDMARMADLGLNLLSEGLADTHGQTVHGVGNTPLEAWGRRRSQAPARPKDLGPNAPPELYEPKLWHSLGAESMLAGGIDLLPVLFSSKWMILYFNAGEHWMDHAEDRYQSVQHMGQDLRRFPNFLGLNYATGDGPTPATMGHVFGTAGVSNFDIIHGQRFEKLRELFEEKYGAIKVDLSDQDKLDEMTDKDRREQAEHGLAWGFRVGEDIRMNVKGPEQKKVLWSQWVNDLYPEQFRNSREALSAMMPEPMLNCGASWGPGAGGGMYPGAFYRALDNPLNDMHGDFGVCNFQYMTGSDILTMGFEERAGRPWVGLDLIDARSRASGVKLLLQALSRNPAGIGVLNLHREFICPWAGRKEKSEDLRLLMRIATRLGDTFMNLERADEIAVVSSFRQEVVEGQPFRALWAAHYIAQKAGYQATVVTDAFCEAHAEELAKQFRAVFLFRMTAASTPELRKALDEFQKAGGLVIVDEACKLDLPGALKLPYTVPAERGPHNMNDHLEFERFFAPHIAKFRETVGARLKPFFSVPETKFTGIRSRDGDLGYLTVFNDGKPPIKDGIFAQFLYEGDRATIGVAATGALYDVLRQRRVETRPAGEGMTFDLDMTHYAGSVFVLAPSPIAGLDVACSPSVAPGELVTLRCGARFEDGAPVKGRLPVECVLTDPGGAVRYRVCRTTNADVRFKVGGNDAEGEWRWQVTDLATGLAAEGTFRVAGKAAYPEVRAVETPIFDAPAVYKLLREREVEVVLFAEQLALLEAAQELTGELKACGVKAELRVIWPSRTVNYRMQWAYETIEDREMREGILGAGLAGRRVQGKNQFGTWKDDQRAFSTAFYTNYVDSAELVYYKDVILLGTGEAPSNPMLDVIERGRLLPRNVSPSFPAPGRGFVACAWGPFHYGHNAVVVYGCDAEGLERSADSLVRLAERKEPPPAEFAPVIARQGQENGQVYSSMGLKAAGETVTASSTTRRAESVFPAVYPRRVTGALADEVGRLCIAQEPLGEGEGANLALVEADGKAARQFRLPAGAGDASAESLAQHLRNQGADALWPARDALKLGAGYLARVDRGVGLYAPDAACKWFYEPFPALGTYAEAKYPRLCQNWARTPDGKLLLAAFYDVTPGGNGDVYTVSRADLVLLNAETGKRALLIEGYAGSHMALSADGSRLIVVDEWQPNKSEYRNPLGGPVLCAWDRSGKEIYHVRIKPPVDEFRVSADGRLAALSFDDPRKQVLLVDVERGRSVYHGHDSIDVGLAVSEDGEFAVVSYSDGAVHKLARDGTVVFEARLPSAGVPAVAPGTGRVHVACHDGFVYTLGSEGQVASKLSFGDAQVEGLDVRGDAPPAGLEPPQAPPFWQGLTKEMVKRRPNPLPGGAAFKGEKKVALKLPKPARWDVALLHFRYKLADLEDELTVSLGEGEERVMMRLPYHALARTASVPLRGWKAGEVELVLNAAGDVTLDQAGLAVLDLSGMTNHALTSRPGQKLPGGSDNVPQVMVPNVIGLLGDPRCEHMAYGFSADAGRGWEKAALPERYRNAKTDRYTYFDGDVRNGTPLYPTARRRGNLRSAQIVLEFQKPRKISTLGVWETPGELPVRAFALECCDDYETDETTKVLTAEWKLVCIGRRNADYFHMHTFAPTEARVWRYTVLDSSAPVQLCAEIELYQESMENLLDLDEGLDDMGF